MPGSKPRHSLADEEAEKFLMPMTPAGSAKRHLEGSGRSPSDFKAPSVVERVVNNLRTDPASGRSLGSELIRGQFAGLLAGTAVGAILAIRTSAEPAWHESTIPVALFGMLFGGFLGVLGGFVGGMSLRLMRSVPPALAAAAAGLAVAVTVAVALFLLGWTTPSNPGAFPITGGVIAGAAAAVATPWIRRSSNASR